MLCEQVKTENESFSAVVQGCAATIDYTHTHTYFGSGGLGRGSTTLDFYSPPLACQVSTWFVQTPVVNGFASFQSRL